MSDLPDRDQISAIKDAWLEPGPRPAHHKAWQNRLRAEWPALARALDAAWEDDGPEVRHLCGLQGYDPMQGDTCPACDVVEVADA